MEVVTSLKVMYHDRPHHPGSIDGIQAGAVLTFAACAEGESPRITMVPLAHALASTDLLAACKNFVMTHIPSDNGAALVPVSALLELRAAIAKAGGAHA